MLIVEGMDALAMLLDDHAEFGRLHARFEAAHTPRLREDLARRLVFEIRAHLKLEEKYAHADEDVETKAALAALEPIAVHDPRYADALRALMGVLQCHSGIQERVLFPALKASMRRSELSCLGRVMADARVERTPEPEQAGLAARAIAHLGAAWKAQLLELVRAAVGSFPASGRRAG